MSRFVAALLQGLNCLANPPGVGPFHSVSNFREEGNLFCSLNKKCENTSGFLSCITLIKDKTITSANFTESVSI